MNNLFAIGELVILQSVSDPRNNGKEYTVQRVLTKGDEYNCRLSGKLLGRDKYAFAYILGELIGESNIYPGQEAPWAESALRKKYNPSEFRYNELIKNLNTKIQEKV